MTAQPAPEKTVSGRRKRLLWVLPAVLALGFAAYHIWDLRLRSGGTGLALAVVDIEEARRILAENDQAAILDIRLHGAPSPLGRTLRIPDIELVRRMGELEPYRNAPLFVLAATDEEAAATAAFLARRDFSGVACVRVDTPPTAQAMAGPGTLTLD